MLRFAMPKILPLLTILLALVPMTSRAYYVEARAPEGSDEVIPLAYGTEGPVEFRIAVDTLPDADGDVAQAIADGFATWSGVECSDLSFARGDDVAGATPYEDFSVEPWAGPNGQPGVPGILVFFNSDPSDWEFPSVGQFKTVYSPETAVAYAGRIALNSANHQWSTTGEAGKLDIQSVITAMVGRVSGITAEFEGNATYAAYAAGDTSKRVLGDDDLAGLAYLYGDASCETQVDPTEVCLEFDAQCPPAPDLGGSDDVDAGTGSTPDAGTTGPVVDGGVGAGNPSIPGAGPISSGDAGGCTCSTAGRSTEASVVQLAALAGMLLLLSARLRRRV